MAYSPILADLIAAAEQDWGDPDANKANILWYGINHVDQALFGIDCVNGEVIGIQAEAKRRKSTVLANVLHNIGLQLAKRDQWLCIDTLESGMPPQAYRDILIAITATRKIIAGAYGTARSDWPAYTVIQERLGSELQITKEFLRFSKRTETQFKAIEWSKQVLAAMPILIFGPAPTMGRARDLEATMARWHKLYMGKHEEANGCLCRVFAADHIQQVSGWESDYGKLEAVTTAYSDFVATHPGSVVFAVSQLSVTSVRNEAAGGRKAQAKGGAKLEAEVNVLFRVDLPNASVFPQSVVIEVQETRRRPPPPVIQEIEPNSGAFLQPARKRYQRE